MDVFEVRNRMKAERKSIFDISLRVTYYARVSTTLDTQENSIENQIAYFQNMIKQNKNWVYVPGYADRIRGESAENRVKFQQMIQDAESDKFDLILTKEISRFARDTVDSLTYTQKLIRIGVGVLFQSENICTIDPDNELRLTIMASIATEEVRKLSERIKFGHKRSIESGKVLGSSRIFGYTKVNCKLIINEKEAEMVRLIFNLYETGTWSTRSIAGELEKRGYLGRNNTPIHHNTVSGIIQNPKYKGYYCGNKVTVVDYRTKKQRFNPESEWVMFKDEKGDVVPAIVSEEQWDRCNAIFKERSLAIKSRTRSIKSKSPLSGKIWCTDHDAPYWRTSYSNSVSLGHPIYQWICREKRRQNAKCCNSFAIMESELYLMLGDVYKTIVPNIESWVSEFIEIYESVKCDESGTAQIESIENSIQKLTANQDKLLDLYMDNIISKEEFAERKSDINLKLESLNAKLENVKDPGTGDIIDSAKRIKEYIETIYSYDSRDLTIDEINDISTVVLDHIDVIPLDKHNMQLEIKLKSADSKNIRLITRPGSKYSCCSGHMSKKMSPEQQYNFERSGLKNGMTLYITYSVYVGF